MYPEGNVRVESRYPCFYTMTTELLEEGRGQRCAEIPGGSGDAWDTIIAFEREGFASWMNASKDRLYRCWYSVPSNWNVVLLCVRHIDETGPSHRVQTMLPFVFR